VKIYTKTGDEGETGLFGGTRVSKASRRVSSYGEVDELNTVLGLARLHPIDDDYDRLLARVQSELFNLGAELAARPGKDVGVPLVDAVSVSALEQGIDAAEAELPALATFILPGGSPGAAHLHHARTVCRRAERGLVALAAEDEVRPVLLVYLNRLSDLLFVLARLANHRAGVADVAWVGRKADGAADS
jgi:cob(I)alamin adenosyltransferase